MSKIKGQDDCYTSSLVINQLASEDMRSFSLLVENVHGTDTVKINLEVKGEEIPHYISCRETILSVLI